MSDGDYTKAIQIAFDLRRSHKLFEVLSETCRTNKSKDHQRFWLATLGIEELRWLFEYIREWNTQEKLYLVAQLVLFQIFSLISPTKISEVPGIRELLEGIRSYTVRHMQKYTKLEESTSLLTCILMGMSILEPDVDARDVKRVCRRSTC